MFSGGQLFLLCVQGRDWSPRISLHLTAACSAFSYYCSPDHRQGLSSWCWPSTLDCFRVVCTWWKVCDEGNNVLYWLGSATVLERFPFWGGCCYWNLPFPQSILFQWHLHLCKSGYSIVLWNMHSDVFKTRWNQRQAGKEKRSQGHCKNVAVCQPKREASEETNLTDTSIWTSNCEKIHFWYLSKTKTTKKISYAFVGYIFVSIVYS